MEGALLRFADNVELLFKAYFCPHFWHILNFVFVQFIELFALRHCEIILPVVDNT